jgi:cyclic pyranopterin phosphate synthase
MIEKAVAQSQVVGSEPEFAILKDNFNRKISYMRISITDRCNLRCTYCMPAWGFEWMDRNSLLTYDEIHRLVGVAAKRGLYKVRVTGGEPLVRDGVVDFVAGLKAIDGIREIALTTNAVLLKKYAQGLKNAGLDRVNISLDSLDPKKFEEITRGHVFWKVWEGIEEAERVGLNPLKINIVLQNGVNDMEAVDFAKMTIDKPYEIRFIEYMPVNDYEDWKSKYIPVADIKARIARELGELIPVKESESDGPSKNYRLEGAKGVVGFITAISDNHFCEKCNRVRLTADGKIRPCLFSAIEVDFLDALRNQATDEDIDSLYDQVLGIKPQAHDLDKFSEEKMLKAMVNIGG